VDSGGETEPADAPAGHERGDKMSGEEKGVIASPNPSIKESEAQGGDPKRVESKPVAPDSSATAEPMKKGQPKPKPRE
jgi:hypothetical protein